MYCMCMFNLAVYMLKSITQNMLLILNVKTKDAENQKVLFFIPQNEINKLYLQVKAFCDVDEKKLAKGVYIYEESKVSKMIVLCIKVYFIQSMDGLSCLLVIIHNQHGMLIP